MKPPGGSELRQLKPKAYQPVGNKRIEIALTIEQMAIQRMEHVGIMVDDLAAATEFFVELGLEPQGAGPVEGRWVDRVVGLDGVRAEIALLQPRTATDDSS